MPAALRGLPGRVALALLAGLVLFMGGYLYRGYADAQQAASQAVEASVQGAKAATKRDSQSLSDRRSAIAKTEPSVATLRGWSGGITRKENHAGTDEEGRGCVSDPWGSPEYLRVLGDAARAGNQAVDASRDVSGAVPGDPGA